MIGVAAAFAEPWQPGAVVPVSGGPAVAWSPVWDGGPAWFAGGPRGVSLLDGAGAVSITSDLVRPRVLLVRQLDDAGDPEVVACAGDGLWLLRGTRAGFAPPRSLSTEPCEDVVAYDVGSVVGLATVSGGELLTWTPTALGLTPTRTGRRVIAGTLAASGGHLAGVSPGGEAWWTSEAPLPEGDVFDVASGPDGFVWLARGRWSGGSLVDSPTGIVGDGHTVWFLDAVAGAVRTVDGPWTPVPVAPAHAVVIPTECRALWVADDSGRSAFVRGACAGPVVEVVAENVEGVDGVDGVEAIEPDAAAVPEYSTAADAIPALPAEWTVGQGEWRVVDVRAGEPVSTTVYWSDRRGRAWRSRGGPGGFSVQGDGAIQFTPSADDVGRWRASVRGGRRRAGLEIHVWPAEQPIGAPADPPLLPPSPLAARPAVAPVDTWVGIGAAGGFGGTDAASSASPYALVLSEVRVASNVAVTFGADSAPAFHYVTPLGSRAHVLAGTVGFGVGGPRWRGGVHAVWGYSVRGVGARVALTPWRSAAGQPRGLELRSTLFTPQLGFELAAAWVVRL